TGTIQSFFDYYLKGTGTPPAGASAMTETCPASAPSAGPYTAATWAELHPGEVDYSSHGAQTISSSAGDPTISKTLDPIAGGGACATVSATDQGAGVASYRLPAATGEGYTLLGAPAVIANLSVSGQFPFIAARLWDVDPAHNTETLVARGIYRIDPNAPDGLQVFQLHPGAWHFAAGHVPKLELLGQDSPYARSSNGQFTIAVSDLELRIPVHEKPNASGTPSAVTNPKPPVTPGGATCRALPGSKIDARRSRGSHRGLRVTGSASEPLCAHASAATQHGQRIIRVYVVAYQVRHNRCSFLTANGTLSRPRSCSNPIRLA